MSCEALLERQHGTIIELRELVGDLLALLDRYQGLPVPKTAPLRVRKYKRPANFCGCGKSISSRAANCVECNAKAMRVVRLCACGNKRRADSEVCRACYTAAIKPKRAKRHDMCACGVRKRKESEQCAACFKRSQRAKVDTHACGCGAPIPLAVTRCVACRAKTKALHTCGCGKPKSPGAERCIACRRVTETGRHDLCACGARKLQVSLHCRTCGQLSRRRNP